MSAIEEPGKNSTGKIIGIIGCGCVSLILLGAIVIGGIFFVAAKALKSADAYTESIAAVESNADATAALGTPIEPGFMPSGSININNGEGDIDFTIPVSGPNGKGTIVVKGKKPSGSPVWIYDTWQLEVEGRTEPIPLSK